jgi:hypothetical protein
VTLPIARLNRICSGWEPIPAWPIYVSETEEVNMTASRRKAEPARVATRTTQWLAALEQELKSRVGWVDEAVSPFARPKRTVSTAGKLPLDAFRPEKAA